MKGTSLYFLFILILGLQSCSGTKQDKQQETITNGTTRIDTLSSDLDTTQQTYPKQISEYTYLLTESDTLFIEKPILKIFEGEYNNNRIKVILTKRMAIESFKFDMVAYIYYDGEEDIITYWLQKKNNGTWTSSSTDDNNEKPYNFSYTSNNLYLIHHNKQYRLIESAESFEAYDDFIFNLKECTEYETLNYNYSYDTSFKPRSSNSLYQKVYSSKSFLDLILGESRYDIAKWGYSINKEIARNIPEEEGCFNNNSTSYTEPIFADSHVFVVLSLEYMYLGGAHGVYTHSYSNFDVKTGKLIQIEDILDTSSTEYRMMFDQKVKNMVRTDMGYDLEEVTDSPHSFYILPKGIKFIFPMYSLSGGAWEKEILITYDDLQPYLKKELYPNSNNN